MIKYFSLFVIIVFALACRKTYEAPVPDTEWNLFNGSQAAALGNHTRNKLEGVFTLVEGAETFGANAALKWSYHKEGADTIYHLSAFCERQVVYMILEGKRLNNAILLNGYWRNMVNTETGIVRFTIAENEGANALLDAAENLPSTPVLLSGTFGLNQSTPELPVKLQYQRALNKTRPVEIIAHRGGGRTADLLPASENSVEILKLASRLGATGVEIDVRLTKDKIPVIYHDATLNSRLIQKNGLIGPIENYTYSQLQGLVRLINGERIPTLRHALDTILNNTSLQFVWLDTKFKGPMDQLRAIQVEYQQKAAAMGRSVTFEIGIPDEDVLKNFKNLSGFQTIPSICELTTEDVSTIRASTWAPRWTLGLQNEAVASMQAAGHKVFVWTIDVPENINKFLQDGRFNGILSNYPSSVAYYHYAKQ